MQGPLILDRYRPIEVKGTGASGTVELCWDTRIQRRVAIKRMPIAKANANGTIPGLAEARTGAMLSRPSIVSVYDFDTTDDEALLIMEAIEGPTVTDLLENTPPGLFDLDIAAAILAAVGDAISFAHENQVLHLDIKPDNILIARGGACKISDFGVSKLADAQGFGEANGGTIGYMPPEQMRRKALDERCDEFALAAVAYEIITGRRPFAARDIDTSIKRINKFDLVPPSSVRDDVDPGIDNVFLIALSPNPEDRYPSVSDFMSALMPYLGNPLQGARRLAEIASDEDDFEEDLREYSDRPSLFERISPRLSFVLGRMVAALLCWWVSASALFNITALNAELAMLIALLPAVGALVKPPYGALIALTINGFSLFLGSQMMPVLGVLALAATAAWIVFFGRNDTADTNCALAVSPLGLVGFTPLGPMLAGFFLPPKRALGAVLVQVVLMLSIGRITGPELLFGSITSISTWIIILGWAASAFLMSLLCSRENRVLAVLGAIVAAIVLLAAQSLALWVITGAPAMPNATWVTATALSCIVMCVVGALEAPVRHKGE